MKAAWVVMAVAVVFASGCAQKDWIDRTLVTENVTGAWAGSFGEGNSYREIRLNLQQEGAKVTGSATLLGPDASRLGFPFTLQGSVGGDVFIFKAERGETSGELMVSGDDMSGQITSVYGTSRISLHRVESASPTGAPPR